MFVTNFFQEEITTNRLMVMEVSASVFHILEHSWWCLIQYNPKLIDGFDMADGEGMECF